MAKIRWENGTRKAEQLRPYKGNAKRHPPEQLRLVAKSIREFGFGPPVAINEQNMILAGHARIEAVLQPGMENYRDVPVRIAHGLSDDQQKAFVIADNRLGERGQWDWEALQLEIGALQDASFDLDLLGFDREDLAGILHSNAGKAPPDSYVSPSSDPKSIIGDVWLLGRHRLVCGDATDQESVTLCLGDLKPWLMVTDAPYGVDYDPEWRNRVKRRDGSLVGAKATGKVDNDGEADWRKAWKLFPGDVIYAWHGGLKAREVAESLEASGFQIRSQIIWQKQQFVIGRGDYHWQHECCYYAVRKGRTGRWAGDRKQSTVWEIDAPSGWRQKHDGEDAHTGIHSTQKMVECMRRPIENNSKPGEHVYDPFLGSGTTMIACEMTGRSCLGIELNPAYVDVAIERWQQFTGKEAVHAGEGSPTFDKIKKARSKPSRARATQGRAKAAAA